MPKVSVIIPTYNRAEFLRSAIRSVLNQTFQDFEIIVIDDASENNTEEVVRSFGDIGIRYFRHELNKGNAAARNTGIKNSGGHYIALLDDDDEWLPSKLEKQVRLLDSTPPIVGAVYTGFVEIEKANGKTVVVTPTKRGSIFNDLLLQNWIGLSTVLLRRECFDKVGSFDENLPATVDYDMWIRIAKEFQFDFIPEPLVKYSNHQSQLSHNYEIVIKGLEAQIKKNGLLFASNRKGFSNLYLSLGKLYCYTGNIRKGRQALLKAIGLYPFEIRNYYNLCLSLSGSRNFKKFKDSKGKLAAKMHTSFTSVLKE
ncbi:MAG: glycosyltransferase family 2 protein [Candidatus Binatia bacterium]